MATVTGWVTGDLLAGEASRRATRLRAARARLLNYGDTPFVFTPASVRSASLLGWWKSDVGVFQNTGMTTATVTDAQNVAGWQDQSGAGHHLTEATNPPIWKTAQVNGNPSVRFNGTNQLLTSLFTLDVPFDLFLVVKQITWVAEASLACGGTGDNFSLEQHSATPQLWIWQGASLGGANSGLAAATWGLVEAGMPLSSPNAYIKVNNGTATSGGAAASAARGGITLAAHPGPSNFGNVEFAEVVLYNAILSAGDQTSLRGYFTGRYGFP